MAGGKQHQVVSDACQTIGNVIEKNLPKFMNGRKVSVVYDAPTDPVLNKSKKDKGILVSVLWLDSALSKDMQSTNTPIVHEEDEDGNIVEFRCGPPSYVRSRFIVTPWCDSLDAQVATGGLMTQFCSFPVIDEDDIHGDSIKAEDQPSIELDGSIDLDAQMRLWDLFASAGQAYRPSLVIVMTLKMDSLKRTAVRRVREKVNIFRKVEG